MSNDFVNLTGFTGVEISGGKDALLQLEQFGRYIDKTKEEIFKLAKEKIREIADKFRESLKQAVYYQSLNLKPLKESYARYKQRMNLDPRILISTGEYIESIEILENEKTVGLLSLSIVHEDREHSVSGINLQFLARVLEFGSKKRKIPARPHWRPVMREFIKLKDILADETVDYIAEKIRIGLNK